MKTHNHEVSEDSKQKSLASFHRGNEGEFLTKDQGEGYQISQKQSWNLEYNGEKPLKF